VANQLCGPYNIDVLYEGMDSSSLAGRFWAEKRVPPFTLEGPRICRSFLDSNDSVCPAELTPAPRNRRV